MKLQTLKGFRDFLPQEALKRNWLIEKIRRVFEAWGYDPLETPTLEPLELFEGQIGEDEKLFYKFKDAGGRNVALRYDQTVPVCRVVGQYFNDLAMPFRRYQIQPAYRAEKPQKGRYREFLQCDADIFGTSSPFADAEVIALSLDIYRAIGFPKAKVLINDRALLKDIPYPALVEIDKLKKIGTGETLKNMVRKGIKEELAQGYLDYVLNAKPNETVTVILNYLAKMDFDPSWYAFDASIVRSFSYSTGPIWEVEIPGYESGSVLGGERYDNLVKKISGLDVCGTGFAVGFDRTLEAAEQFNLIPSTATKTKVLVTVFDKNCQNESIKICSAFRAKNINAELYPDPEKKLDKQLKYADRKGIPWVMVIGPDEIKSNTVVLKNMQKKLQEKVAMEEAITKINKN